MGSVIVTAGMLLASGPVLAQPDGPPVDAAASGGARIVTEWRPGHPEATLGGDLVVDGYGINGLGAYELHGVETDAATATTFFGVCVQADVGHSTAAAYRPDATPAVTSAELGYLLWRYLSSSAGAPPVATDDEAAAINALAWRYAGARRSSGGAVWQRDELDVVVLGVGHLGGVEATIERLGAEAAARRGPWTLEVVAANWEPAAVEVSALVQAAGGPISDHPVTFRIGDVAASATTDDDGVATARLDAVGALEVRTSAPGPVVTWSAPGSQRVAVAGTPRQLRASAIPPPPSTTTTTTTTTAPTTTTTTAPTTTSTTTATAPTTTVPTTTIAPTTTTAAPTTTVAPTTTTVAPSTTTVGRSVPPTTPTPTSPSTTPRPTLPRTGGGTGRDVGRWAAWLFAVGAVSVLVATRRPGTVEQT